jgi:hypothetical protein
LLATSALTAVILYFTWYKNLPPPGTPLEETNEEMSEETENEKVLLTEKAV